ncbi:MAG: bile acid:sodium symporter family protein [Flavobacteriales bacterium]|nr:bile acid:sodium symporter family protein [Flavobacteriales bacterium]
MLSKLTSLFPVWVILASVIALIEPASIAWFNGPFITYGLGFIMLGMGITINVSDFKQILKFPSWVGVGLALQFTVMPLFGYFLGYLFKLPTEYAVGLVLVACCPGGTASNVIAFLAKVNVALSVCMTVFSTSAAIILTPLLTSTLVGSRVDVDALGLFISTLKVVFVPVFLGVMINTYWPQATKKVVNFSPLVAVVLIALIVSSVIGSQKEQILSSGLNILYAVVCLHLGGFVFGYSIAKLLLKKTNVARTISIEVGMQNSGLGVVLARNNFASPLTAIPSAISSLTHCLIGSIAAAMWRSKNEKD